MQTQLNKKILADLRINKLLDQDIVNYFELLLNQEKVTRDEGSTHHISAYFVPYNPQSKKVLISHHLKSGLWLIPGGHIDSGETPQQAVVREWKEELHTVIDNSQVHGPFYVAVTPIAPNPKQPICSAHYDIWFYVETDGEAFDAEEKELGEVQWMSFDEARKLTSDGYNKKALAKLETLV